jgi:hypothetical protein
MNLCANKHEEICYEGRECPVCSLREEMQEDIDDLLNEIKDLELRLDNNDE